MLNCPLRFRPLNSSLLFSFQDNPDGNPWLHELYIRFLSLEFAEKRIVHKGSAGLQPAYGFAEPKVKHARQNRFERKADCKSALRQQMRRAKVFV